MAEPHQGTVNLSWQAPTPSHAIAKQTLHVFQRNQDCSSDTGNWRFDLPNNANTYRFESKSVAALGVLNFRIDVHGKDGTTKLGDCDASKFVRTGLQTHFGSSIDGETPYYSDIERTGDFNADGAVDLLRASEIGITIFLNQGVDTPPVIKVYSKVGDFYENILVGDYNNDGYDDFATTDYRASNATYTAAGVVHIVFGGDTLADSGLLADVSKKVYGLGNFTYLCQGEQVFVTDFTKDGIDDIVCATASRNNAYGSVDIIVGKTDPWADEADIDTAGFRFYGEAGAGFEGINPLMGSTGHLYDATNDGYDDLIFLATGNNGDAVTFIFPASTNVTNRTFNTGYFRRYTNSINVAFVDLNDDSIRDLVFMLSGNLSYIEGGTNFPASGSISSVATRNYTFATSSSFNSLHMVGDFNGDNREDFVWCYRTHGPFGNAHGLVAIFPGTATMPASGTLSSRATVLTGTAGASMSGCFAGDVNNDGNDDLMIYSNAGMHVVLGGTLPTSGNLVDRSYLISGVTAYDEFFSDVTGDGAPDLILGFFNDSENGKSLNGSITIIKGGASFPTSGGAIAALGTKIYGDFDNERAFLKVSFADLNGDGANDIIGNSYVSAADGKTDNGTVSVIFGRTDFGTSGSISSKGFRFAGPEDEANFGKALKLVDINQDDQLDLLVASQNFDTNTIDRADIIYGPVQPSSELQQIFGPELGDTIEAANMQTIDFDGDGNLDFLLDGGFSAGIISGDWFLND